MPVVLVECPHCRRSYSVDGSLIGRSARCRNCGRSFAMTPSGEVAATGPDASSVSDPPPGTEARAGALPERIGRFVIRERLGAGAFGAVYRATDPSLEREVALKVPHREIQEDPLASARFLREARAAARLRHPSIVPVFDAGADGQTSYIASAFIPGRSLDSALADGPFDPRRASRIVGMLADALHHAHEEGIVHRDVKPANVLLDEDDRPHLTDFGLARLAAGGAKLTKAGMILGTPAYLAPEQAAGKSDEASPASDQYSLGVTLYELLCGRTPFVGPAQVVIYHTLHSPPPPLRGDRPEVPAELETICLKALAKRPEDRYSTCRELARDLGRWLAGRPTSVEIPAIPPPVPASTSGDPMGLTPAGAIEGQPAALMPSAARRLSGWIGRLTPLRRPIVASAAAGVLVLCLLGVVLYRASVGRPARRDPGGSRVDARLGAGAQTIVIDVPKKPSPIEEPAVAHPNAEAPPPPNPEPGPEVAHGGDVRQGVPKPAAPASDRSQSPVPAPVIVARRQAGKLAPTPGDVELERRWAYAERMTEAERFLEARNPGGAASLLAECPADLRGWEWSYCRQLCDRKLIPGKDATLILHPGGASAFIFSPDGSRLITASSSQVADWEVSTGRLISRHPAEHEPTKVLRGIAASPQGGLIATWGDDGVIRIREAGSFRLLYSLRGYASSGGMAFSSDGKMFVSGDRDGHVRIWSMKTGTVTQTLDSRIKDTPVAINPAGLIASAGPGETIKLWDAPTGNLFATLPLAVKPVLSLAFSPRQRRIGAAMSGGVSGRIWDLVSGMVFVELPGHDATNRIGFSPDGTRILTAGRDGQVRLWDAEVGLTTFTFRSAEKTRQTADALFSPDRESLAISFDTGSPVRIYRAPRPADPAQQTKGDRPISAGNSKAADGDRSPDSFGPTQLWNNGQRNERLDRFSPALELRYRKGADNPRILIEDYLGRSNVLVTHPMSQKVPFALLAQARVPAGKRTRLALEVSHHRAVVGDWRLVVKADGRLMADAIVGPATVNDGWAALDLDLSEFAGRTVVLELQNRATDWYGEFAYWNRIAVVSEP